MKYAALLRGINVGGKNKLAMKDLARIFEEAECTAVATYIQSGNVVFEAKAAVARKLPAAVSAVIAERFGLRVPVMLRSGAELAGVVAGNPFLRGGLDTKFLHVCFLADLPTGEAVQGLDPMRSAPDRFTVIGREIYLHTPNGAGESKLTNAWFDSRLRTISTARNWATVSKLAELTG